MRKTPNKLVGNFNLHNISPPPPFFNFLKIGMAVYQKKILSSIWLGKYMTYCQGTGSINVPYILQPENNHIPIPNPQFSPLILPQTKKHSQQSEQEQTN
jgi:hypothetical protein